MAWPRIKLSDVVEFISTGPFGSLLHSEDYVTGGTPLVNPSNIEDGVIIPDDAKAVDDATLSRLENYRLAEGDVVVARRGELGRCAVVRVEQSGWLCGTGSFFVRPSKRLLAEFLVLVLSSAEYREILDKASTGATMPNISNKTLQELLIPLPPLSEQKRIVAILDEAFEGIRIATANAEKNLANVDELFASELDRIVLSANGRKARLGEITDRVSVGHVGITSPYYRDAGVLFLRTQNVTSSGLVFDDVKFITPEFHAKLTKSSLQKGDVLISRVITDRISCGVMPAGIGPANCANVILVRPGKRILPEYLQQVIRARSTQRFLLSKKVGSAQSVVNTSVLQELDITLPTLDDQAMLLSKIERVESGARILDETYRVQAASHEQLKQSILSRAFSGQLTATKGLAA